MVLCACNGILLFDSFIEESRKLLSSLLCSVCDFKCVYENTIKYMKCVAVFERKNCGLEIMLSKYRVDFEISACKI